MKQYIVVALTGLVALLTFGGIAGALATTTPTPADRLYCFSFDDVRSPDHETESKCGKRGDRLTFYTAAGEAIYISPDVSESQDVSITRIVLEGIPEAG